jgi:type VI secretion system secreted protein VgrG
MTDVMERSGSLDGVRQATLIGDLAREVHEIELSSFTATERLSEPFTVLAEVITPEPVDFLPHLGLSAGIKVQDVAAVRRNFVGKLFEARYLQATGAGYHYQLTIRPWFALLDLNLNTRCFQQQSAIDVVKKVLEGQRFRIVNQSSADQVRGYCTQYRESDFAFVSRLLEEDGYHYCFEHEEGGETMLIAANSSAARAVEGATGADYVPLSGTEARALSFWEWTERVAPVPSKVTLHDTHHLWRGAIEGPEISTKSAEPRGGGPAHRSELFDFPGGAGAVDSFGDVGRRGGSLADIRLQSARAEQRRFTGEGDIFALGCGTKVTLREHPMDAWNQDYLILSTTHTLSAQTHRSGHGGDDLRITVEAIPLNVPWRPALKTPKPVVAGPTTAVVIGAGDIDCDETGRVRVRFSWERRSGSHDEIGIWIRVAQAWAGGGYGMENIPRNNTEVIVDFVDGDPDLPVITGRLHSHSLTPPLELPANKTQSTWKSQTVGASGDYSGAEEPPSGTGFNEVRLEDKGGSEEVYVHAQRLRTDWTRLDEKHKVGRDFVERVGRDRTTEVKQHETLTVEMGDETRTLKQGSRKTEIMKADTLTLKTGDSTTTVQMGNLKIEVSMGKIEISAMQEIVLKVGPTTKMTMKPTGIDLEGMMLNVKGTATTNVEAAMTTVKGTGMLTAEGAIVMIN